MSITRGKGGGSTLFTQPKYLFSNREQDAKDYSKIKKYVFCGKTIGNIFICFMKIYATSNHQQRRLRLLEGFDFLKSKSYVLHYSGSFHMHVEKKLFFLYPQTIGFCRRWGGGGGGEIFFFFSFFKKGFFG